MLFLNAFVSGFAIMLGIEVALGLCMALKHVTGGKKK
jgi:hypothetical protein